MVNLQLLSFIRCMSSKAWRITRLNHVAIVVPDLKKASGLFKGIFGAKVSEPKVQKEHGVYTVFVELENSKIELLHPFGESSPIEKFLEKHPSGGIHHVCLEVDNLQEALKDLKNANIRTLSDEPKIGAHGLPVIFLHPKDMNGVLTELEEPQKKH